MNFQRSALVAALALVGAAASAQAAVVSFKVEVDNPLLTYAGQTTIVHLYGKVDSNPGTGSGLSLSTTLGLAAMSGAVDFVNNGVVTFTGTGSAGTVWTGIGSTPIAAVGGVGDGVKNIGGAMPAVSGATNFAAPTAALLVGVGNWVEIGSFEVAAGNASATTALNFVVPVSGTTGSLYVATTGTNPATQFKVTTSTASGAPLNAADTYNLTPALITVSIPEPASMALLAMGGLCLLGRKRA